MFHTKTNLCIAAVWGSIRLYLGVKNHTAVSCSLQHNQRQTAISLSQRDYIKLKSIMKKCVPSFSICFKRPSDIFQELFCRPIQRLKERGHLSCFSPVTLCRGRLAAVHILVNLNNVQCQHYFIQAYCIVYPHTLWNDMEPSKSSSNPHDCHVLVLDLV